MQLDDAHRVLGLRLGATHAEIRQAYHDLVRVWHPDRFQADGRLQKVAAEQLRRINEAYALLERQSSTAAPPANRPGCEEGRTSQPQRRRSTVSAMRAATVAFALARGAARSPAICATVGAFVLLNLGIALIPILRTPIFDLDLVNAHARLNRPRILMPSRILDPESSVRVASDTLTEWARGKALNLWTPVSRTASAAPSPIALVPPPSSPTTSVSRRMRAAITEPTPALASGTELLTAQRGPAAGDLTVVNNTDLEAVALLLRGQAALRAVFIQPRQKALIRSVANGSYDVQVRLGKALDTGHLQFRSDRATLEPVGPLDYFSVTSASGTQGQHFEIVVNQSSATQTVDVQTSRRGLF